MLFLELHVSFETSSDFSCVINIVSKLKGINKMFVADTDTQKVVLRLLEAVNTVRLAEPHMPLPSVRTGIGNPLRNSLSLTSSRFDHLHQHMLMSISDWICHS